MVAHVLIEGPFDGHQDQLPGIVVPPLLLVWACPHCERPHTIGARDDDLTVRRITFARDRDLRHALYLLDGERGGVWRYRWEGTDTRPGVQDSYEQRKAVTA